MIALNHYDRALIAQALQHYAHYLAMDPILSMSQGHQRRSERCLELAWLYRPAAKLTAHAEKDDE